MKVKPLSSLSIFMPAYNESGNIKSVIKDATLNAQKFTDKYEIIIVNDGSKDDTKEVVESITKENKSVRIVNHKKNKGYGAAVKTGLSSCKHEWIFFTDSDGQFKFDEMQKFIDSRDEADLLIGYRKKRMDPFHRIFIAQVLLKIWNYVFFGLSVKDVDCAYKLFKKSVSDSIPLKTESAITVTEFLVKAKMRGYSISQIPVTHYPRKVGTQTGAHVSVIRKAMRDSFQLLVELRFR